MPFNLWYIFKLCDSVNMLVENHTFQPEYHGILVHFNYSIIENYNRYISMLGEYLVADRHNKYSMFFP